MQNFDKRITALEQIASATVEPIFIHFVGMDAKDRGLKRVTQGDQEWLLQPRELEQELKDRAMREVSTPIVGCSTVFLCW